MGRSSGCGAPALPRTHDAGDTGSAKDPPVEMQARLPDRTKRPVRVGTGERGRGGVTHRGEPMDDLMLDIEENLLRAAAAEL
jgi:hypothetical protein